MAEQAKLFKAQLAHQKQLVHTSIQIQEEERRRVALELHDDLVAKLTALLFGIKSAPANAMAPEVLEECIQTARQISHNLRPPLLEEHSIAELTQGILGALEGVFQVHYFENVNTQQALPPIQKLHVIRILQELLANSLKYAQASTVTVYLRLTEQYLFCLVHDNGTGFDYESASKGLGLKNIALRAQLLAATYKFTTRLQQGTKFAMLVPQRSIEAPQAST